jgi:hypothetical protein
MQETVHIFPNPSNGQFSVEWANGFEKQISVMDITGRVVVNKTTLEERTNFNITDLPNGVYYVQLRSNNSSNVFKIIKD